MKITGVLCTFNDCEYLDAALTSFKDAVDKLYVIEGSWKSSQAYEDTGERSSVDTFNVLDRHVDNKKVVLIQANEANEAGQRQIGMERAKEDGSDWHWFLDSDEIYTRNLLQIIKTKLATAPKDLYGFRLRSYNFINSFNRWYDGNYSRISRVTPHAAFYTHNDVWWSVEKPKIVTLSDQWRYFHYCYVKKDATPFWRKLKMHEVEVSNFTDRTLPHYGANGHIYKIPNDIPQYEFSGHHPAIMKNHPNVKDNIYDDKFIRFASH